MTRLLAIAVLIVVAFVLFRYRTNEKVQKATVITLIGAFLILYRIHCDCGTDSLAR